MDGSNVFTPSGSIDSLSSQGLHGIPDSPVAGTSYSLDNLDLGSFSFRWDLGLDCEDENESVSDYGTVLHTGEAALSDPPTTDTGLSAVEEITESGLTDSRTSTANRPSLSVPPSDNELGLLPSRDRKNLEATKHSKGILERLRGAIVGDRLLSHLSIRWPVLAPAPPVVETQASSREKTSVVPHLRPRNKLRKKTRPSIAITLEVEPASSFSLAQPQDRPSQPLPQPLEALQTSSNSVSAPPVVGFPSARSILSFQLPPVFSRARSKVLQKSTYRLPNDMGVINRTSITNQPDVDSSGFRTGKSGGRVWWDSQQPMQNSGRTGLADGNGIGGFPTPIRSANHRGRAGRSREGTPAHKRPSRMSTSWELGLGLGQDLGLRICRLCNVRGG